MSDKLYDCFGSDDDSDSIVSPSSNTLNNEETSVEASGMGRTTLQNTSERNSARDKSCGVLAFHHNTERSLLMHVQNSISTSTSKADEILPCESVLKEIDSFCSRRHWMMCVGPEKGGIIRDTLQKAIEQRMTISPLQNKTRFVAVELGTYCGYGSIFLSSMLKQQVFQQDHENLDFHLFTVEINPEFKKVAEKMIELADVQDIVTVVENDLLMNGDTADVGELIKASYAERFDNEEIDRIDFLMIDHDKDSYLSDLKRLEKSGLIRSGTIVAADNVIFAGITEYINYMQDLEKYGIVKTCTREASVEYCEGEDQSEHLFTDGVGKHMLYSHCMSMQLSDMTSIALAHKTFNNSQR
jgi:catechol O-methyltransferase